MKHTLTLACLSLMVMAAVSSCKPTPDDDLPPKDVMHYQYYPLEIGSFRIYEADSIIYKYTFPNPDTVRFQVREVVESSMTDNLGEKMYRIERYRRADSLQNWQLVSVYTAKQTETELQRVEENIRYVKLVYPVENGKSWNANKYNIHDSLHYDTARYVGVHQSWQNNLFSFDSTVVVEYANYKDFIDESYSAERFATGVGLVDKDVLRINTQPAPRLKQGFIYRERLIRYGK